MQIPQYDKTVPVGAPAPAPSQSAESAALPWQSLAEVGKQTTDLAVQIRDRQDDIFRAQEIGNRAVQAESRIADLMTRIQTERDPKNAVAAFDKEFATIKDETLDGVEDYKVAQSMTSYLAQRQVEGSVKTRHLSWQWTVENDQADTLKNIDDLVRLATMPGATEDDFHRSRDLAIERITVGEQTGTFTPLVAEDLRKKTNKRFISEYYASLIEANPQDALDRRSLLRELDPLDQDALYRRAVVARDRQEVREHKMDEVLWKQNAAAASIRIRKGELTEEDINLMYESGDVGPEQLNYLRAVLDASTARRDVDNIKTSQSAMHGILNEVYMQRLDATTAAKRIYAHPSILPAEKDHALATLAAIGRASDKLPGTISRAVELYRTTVFPSSFSMNPRQDEAEAFGGVMREFWTDYFANEQKYNSDPNLLIKRAIEKTTPNAASVATDPNPYKDLSELAQAYQVYVIDAAARGDRPTGRHRWDNWFRRAGGVMPPWPE